MKFSIKGFFSKCDQIRSFLQTWFYLLKKSLMENFIFCAVYGAAFSEEPCVTLVTLYSKPEKYSESCQAYITQRFLNEPRIYPSISRTLTYFEIVIYSEPCPLYNNKNLFILRRSIFRLLINSKP